MPVDVLSVTVRALSFLTLFQAAGIALFLALAGPELPDTGPTLRRIGSLAALSAAVFIIAQYLLEAARMSGELGGVLDPTLQGILLRSAASATLFSRLLGLLLIMAGLRGRGGGGRTVGIIGIVTLLTSFTFVGHTSQGPLHWLLSPLLFAHVCVVAFWYGSLLPLSLVSSREPPATAASIVEKFSARAIWLVPALFLAGLILAVMLLPDLAALHRPYGELLLTKVSGFCALMLLASLNRWRFGPALRRGELAAGRRFRCTVVMEFALLATILCVTAVMTSLYSPDG